MHVVDIEYTLLLRLCNTSTSHLYKYFVSFLNLFCVRDGMKCTFLLAFDISMFTKLSLFSFLGSPLSTPPHPSPPHPTTTCLPHSLSLGTPIHTVGTKLPKMCLVLCLELLNSLVNTAAHQGTDTSIFDTWFDIGIDMFMQ